MENKYSFILEDNIERRRMDDRPLVNFWLWAVFFFAGVIAAVIVSMLIFPDLGSSYELSCEVLGGLVGSTMGLCMVYLQTKRVNAFIVRKTEWCKTIVEFTNQHSEDSRNLRKLNDLINPELFSTHIKTIDLNKSLLFVGITGALGALMTILDVEEEAAMILLIAFLVIGFSVVCIVIYEYPMNALWNKIQMFENEFDGTLGKVWKENLWIEKPIEFYIDPGKKRNYFLWMFFSIITFGIILIIWNYKIYTDPDNMYYRFHEKEDKILEVIEKIEQQKRSEIEN